MRRILFGLSTALLLAHTALAGPVADFEKAVRSAYGDYRAALFMTNAGKSEDAAKSIEAFAAKWTALQDTWGAKPPPQYEEDQAWSTTLSRVGGIATKAADAVKTGKLQEAHEALEGIRDALGELRARNGVVTFSDRMNAYHMQMEHALGLSPEGADAARLADIHETAAVLKYLAREVLKNPPADAAGNEEFGKLAAAMELSVAAYVEAARLGDASKIKAAQAGLKPAYSKLFLKFG